MNDESRVNILLVDDQPAKLLAYEVILRDLGENLIKATSAKEALECLLKVNVAVVLVDVCMPELDGFELVSMIREHPRFQKTAIIFISAIHLTDVDRLRGYEMGAVDYVPVPVVAEVLRAKVKVFIELHRKTRQLEQLNAELERRVSERTAELESSNRKLRQSEQGRTLALAAGQMGSWSWDLATDKCIWDEGQYRIFDVDPATYALTLEHIQASLHPEDGQLILQSAMERLASNGNTFQSEFRVRRPDGTTRWCFGAAAATVDADGRIVRISGVTVDITERKEAEERQVLLTREVDHRARNALAVTQAIVRLTKAKNIDGYIAAVQGRIAALARTHTLLSQVRWAGADINKIVDEEMAAFRIGDAKKVVTSGPGVTLPPATAQSLALILHELATNAAKYGALCSRNGSVALTWTWKEGTLTLRWVESNGPAVSPPSARGFGSKIIHATIVDQLHGEASFEWPPGGLVCVLSFPLDEKKPPANSETEMNGPERKRNAIIPNGSRILLVEDEVLIAIMMADLLNNLGFSVVGPFARLNDAFAAIADNDLSAAVLDVNLNGETVYPVAEMLTEKGVPFVFVTGYDVENIDERFGHIPVLQKPVDHDMIEKAFCNGLGITLDHRQTDKARNANI